jgi:hypothetical protein
LSSKQSTINTIFGSTPPSAAFNAAAAFRPAAVASSSDAEAVRNKTGAATAFTAIINTAINKSRFILFLQQSATAVCNQRNPPVKKSAELRKSVQRTSPDACSNRVPKSAQRASRDDEAARDYDGLSKYFLLSLHPNTCGVISDDDNNADNHAKSNRPQRLPVAPSEKQNLDGR